MKAKGQVARVDRLRISRRGAEAPIPPEGRAIPPEGRAPRVPRLQQVARGIGDSQSSSLRIGLSTLMPGQHVYFPLIRPVFRSIRQTSADRILPNVMPFFGVTFPAPELAIEEILLPNRLRARARPMSRGLCSPEAHPVLERRSWKRRRRTKQMQMIRHDHVPSHAPVARPFPHLEQHRVNLWKVQQQSSPSYANGHELDDRLIRQFPRWQVWQGISARVSLEPWHATEADGSFVLSQGESDIRRTAPRTIRRDELPRVPQFLRVPRMSCIAGEIGDSRSSSLRSGPSARSA